MLHRSFSALNTSLQEEISFENSREMLPETIPKTSRGQSNSIETVQFIPDAAASRQNSILSHPSRGLMARLTCFQLFCPGYDCKATAKQTVRHFQFPILQRCEIFSPFLSRSCDSWLENECAVPCGTHLFLLIF